jgi:hypothetical protein
VQVKSLLTKMEGLIIHSMHEHNRQTAGDLRCCLERANGDVQALTETCLELKSELSKQSEQLTTAHTKLRSRKKSHTTFETNLIREVMRAEEAPRVIISRRGPALADMERDYENLLSEGSASNPLPSFSLPPPISTLK